MRVNHPLEKLCKYLDPTTEKDNYLSQGYFSIRASQALCLLHLQGTRSVTLSSSLTSKNKPNKIILPICEEGNILEKFTCKKTSRNMYKIVQY